MQLLLARSSFYGKRSICDLSTSTLQTFGDNVKMKFAGANNGSARTHPQWIPKVDEQKENLEQVMTMLTLKRLLSPERPFVADMLTLIDPFSTRRREG